MAETLLYVATAGFEAARNVQFLPEGHRSRRLHGHSYLAEIRAELPPKWADFPGGEVAKLTAAIQHCIAPLDYNHLNTIIDHPTDENLARWIRNKINVPGINSIGIQSTKHEGVDMDVNDHAHIWRRYIFQSAHQLPKVPKGHKCGRMHGHGFEVIIHADQDLGSREIGVDYDHIDECWKPIHQQLNMACLNDIPGLENPTSEMISKWIWDRLKTNLPELSWVTVYETASAGAQFDGKHYRIWKEHTFDSAVQLKRAPENSFLYQNYRRLYGHTYTLRLHLTSPLDEVMGWTIDYGDVKELFNPIFQEIDHQPLHELPGLEDADTGSLLRWIKQRASPILPQLDRVDLYETMGCGAILSWGDIGPTLPV